VTPCSAVVGYQNFRSPFCLQLQALKLWYPTATIDGVTTEKNWTCISTAVKTSNLELQLFD